MTRPARFLAACTLACVASGIAWAGFLTIRPERPPDLDYRTVFVIDFSANTTGRQRAMVTNQLVSSLRKLRPVQKYSILVMSDGKVSALSDVNLIEATKDHAKRAEAFLTKVTPGGDAPAEVAMRKALALKPTLTYFYACGPVKELEAAKKLVAEYVDQGEPGPPGKFGPAPKPLKIHTALLFNKDDDTAIVLKEIADLRHGKSVFVSADDFAQDSDSYPPEPTTQPTTQPTEDKP